MDVSRFEVFEEQRDGMLVLSVSGELDLATAPDLCMRLTRLRMARRPVVVIDLTDLRFCDSTGLRALLGEAREARIAGGRLSVIVPPGSAVRRLLDLTGADEVLGVHDDADQAMSALGLGASVA
jgi:anti-sigma B factor antagonist